MFLAVQFAAVSLYTAIYAIDRSVINNLWGKQSGVRIGNWKKFELKYLCKFSFGRGQTLCRVYIAVILLFIVNAFLIILGPLTKFRDNIIDEE